MYPVGTPLSHVLILEQRAVPGATGEFSRLLHHLALGAKVVAKAVAHAGLMDDVLGDTEPAPEGGRSPRHPPQWGRASEIPIRDPRSFGARGSCGLPKMWRYRLDSGGRWRSREGCQMRLPKNPTPSRLYGAGGHS